MPEPIRVEYNKLVRDKMPGIITAHRNTPEWRIADRKELLPLLEQKLKEEFAEYQKSGCVSELADMVEVVHALLAAKSSGEWELEEERAEKAMRRGRFDQGVFLIAVTYPDAEARDRAEGRIANPHEMRHAGDYSNEDAVNENDTYDRRKIKVACPHCYRISAALLSPHTKSYDGGWRWVGCDHKEPYTSFQTICTRCRRPYTFTVHTPQ